MYVSNSQSVPDLASVAELRQILRELLPVLEKLIPIASAFCDQDTGQAKSSPCKSCPDHESCSKPCDKLQNLLPKVTSGRGRRENRKDFCEDTLVGIQQQKHLNVFHEYDACKHILTNKQWLVVYLYYHDCKTLQEISQQLGKSISTVGEHLKEAQKRKAKYDRQIRNERLDFSYKKLNGDP